MRPVRQLILIFMAVLSACSMRSAIDSLTSEEDRALGQEMVSRLRSGDQAWLQQRFDPQLWAQSGKDLARVPSLYPGGEAETELIGFNISTNMTGGRTERKKEFTLVTQGGGRWTVTTFEIFSTGGPDRVVQWSVTPHSSPPAELTMIETWDSIVPWIWAGLFIALLGVTALVVWLVRRSRRRRGPPMGQPPGTV